MTTLNANWGPKFIVSQNENSAKTYTINWAGELDTDTISSDTWTTEDSSLSITNESNTTTTSTCRLSASDPGTYRAVNQIITAAGDTQERVIVLQVANNGGIDNGIWGN